MSWILGEVILNLAGFIKVLNVQAMALRKVLFWNPQFLCARGLRTQVWPKGTEEAPRHPRPWTEPGIMRFNEADFDDVAARQQELRLVMQVRELLVRQPERMMDMSEISARNPSLSAAVQAHSGIFKVLHFGESLSLVCFTAEAEFLHKQEEDLRREMEERSVRVLRKLLMLSVERRLPSRRVGSLAVDLGLPSDFQHDLLIRNSEFFKLSTSKDYTTWLSLTAWDPELAVSYAEVQHKQRKPGMMTEIEMWTPKGYILSKRHRKLLARFREAPFVSPYADSRGLKSLKIEFEKHAVAGMHELLSLTLKKSLTLRTLAEFNKEFSFSHKPLNLALRHPELFYVSPRGKQDTIFLRAAYSRGELLSRNPLLLVREQFAKLLDHKRVNKEVAKLKRPSSGS